MNKKLSQQGSTHIVIIVCLVLALVTALGWLFYQNFLASDTTKRETELVVVEKETDSSDNAYAGWKTYESTNYGYSLKYPADWIVINEKSDDGPYIRNVDPASKPDAPRDGTTNYPEGYINLRVFVEEDGANFRALHDELSPAQFYDKLGKENVSGGIVVFKAEDVKSIKINRMAAKSTKAIATETDEDIFLLHDSKLYVISIYPYGGSDNKTVKMILDTFNP